MKISICIFLMVATFCIYSQVQDHEFINFDDDKYVTQNLNVKAGLTSESVSWAFTTESVSWAYWHPVTWLSHMLDYELYGDRPKGHHLTSLFFHIANALILFMVLLRMTGKLWRCAFVAAMFAFHPLNVESVAWVAERKNVLSTLFWLITMWAYIHYAAKPTVKRYGLVLLFFALGLMSKPMLVTLPFVLLLLDYWPLRRFKFLQERDSSAILEKNIAKESETLRLVLEKIPLFLLTAGLSIVTFIAQKSSGAMNYAANFTFSTRLTNAMVSYLEYLGKMIWPRGLSILYPHPVNALPVWQGILCGIALVGITIISIRLIRKAPYFAVGWFWYLGTLVPVIGIVQIGVQAMADRYAYVPLIGIFIVIAWGVPELISKWRCKKKVLSIADAAAIKSTQAALVGIIIFTLLITTWIQVSHWKSSITVFKHAIRVTDKKYTSFAVVHYNLGVALFTKQKNKEAISHYKMAIKLRPTHVKAHYNLGNRQVAEGKNKEAISHYKMAIKLKPTHVKAHYNLGNRLVAEGKNKEAISHYKMAIKLKPTHAKAHNNLGVALLNKGRTSEAISHYKMAIQLKPDFAEAHNNLGNRLVAEGKNKEAISHYKMAIKLKPTHAKAHNNLGVALLNKGRTSEAISHYKMAIKLKPTYAKAHYNLGRRLVAEGKNKEAISHYKMAIKLKPTYAKAHYNLGIALFQKGEIKEAIDHYRETVRLRPDLVAARDNLELALLRLQELE